MDKDEWILVLDQHRELPDGTCKCGKMPDDVLHIYHLAGELEQAVQLNKLSKHV